MAFSLFKRLFAGKSPSQKLIRRIAKIDRTEHILLTSVDGEFGFEYPTTECPTFVTKSTFRPISDIPYFLCAERSEPGECVYAIVQYANVLRCAVVSGRDGTERYDDVEWLNEDYESLKDRGEPSESPAKIVSEEIKKKAAMLGLGIITRPYSNLCKELLYASVIARRDGIVSKITGIRHTCYDSIMILIPEGKAKGVSVTAYAETETICHSEMMLSVDIMSPDMRIAIQNVDPSMNAGVLSDLKALKDAGANVYVSDEARDLIVERYLKN